MSRGKKTQWTRAQREKICELALIGCKTKTIAEVLGVDDVTLADNFGPLIKKKRAEYHVALHQAQYCKSVKERDTGMLCFLGKNELGQVDRVDHSASETLVNLLMALQARGRRIVDSAIAEQKMLSGSDDAVVVDAFEQSAISRTKQREILERVDYGKIDDSD